MCESTSLRSNDINDAPLATTDEHQLPASEESSPEAVGSAESAGATACADALETTPESELPKSKKVERLILIDDEGSVLFALKLLLQQVLHFDVRDYGSPLAALDFFRNDEEFGAFSPDLIICDLKMPRVNGLGVLAEAKRLHPNTPFVLMSAHATDQEVAQARSLGAYGFLAKPFTPAQLTGLITELESS